MPFSDWKTRPPEPSAPIPEPPRLTIWQRWRRRILVVLLVLLVVIAGGLYSTYQATQQAPEFYEKIVAKPPVASDAPPVREVVKEQIEQIESAAKTKKNWRFEFTQDQINEFFAKELPEQAPNLLPPSLKDPRIKIEEGKALLGCQYDSEKFKAVLWVEFEAKVAENGKAIELIPKSAGAGMLPMPISRLFERLEGVNPRTNAFSIELIETSQSILLQLNESALPKEQADYRIDAIKLEPEKLSLEGSFTD